MGATGSIGTSTLEVAREQGLQITLAAAHQDHEKLLKIASEYQIPAVALTGISNQTQQLQLQKEHPELGIHFGETELLKLLRTEDYDIALNAISGSAGLSSTFAILERGKRLALANKESLVMAGHLVTKIPHRQPIIPVDSEHSAIFQAMGTHPHQEIRKLHITASGGAFRDLPLEDFKNITVQQALTHPNWRMGAKVTLDSATMFNKALEVMEAHWLFEMPYAQIEAVIHPQSIIHSLVEFVDGSFLAQLSVPDMKLPILYALSYPERWESKLVQTRLDSLPSLTFREIDPHRYPLFYLGLQAAEQGGIFPTVINAAVEGASRLFREGKIGFLQISDHVAMALDRQEVIAEPDLETIIEINRRVYHQVYDNPVVS